MGVFVLYRPGSVMVDYTINATDNSFDFKAANSIVTNILMDSTDNFAQSGNGCLCNSKIFIMNVATGVVVCYLFGDNICFIFF